MQLENFNNITKSLNFNLYDVRYAVSAGAEQAWRTYIHSTYNTKKLSQILTEVTQMIGATVLNIAEQAYEPSGASVTLLIAEQSIEQQTVDAETVVMHLDKSHISVHTYPAFHVNQGIHTVRVDIDVSTCGLISPLTVLNFLMNSFRADIVTLDYKIRGFSQNQNGVKQFSDHAFVSIQDYLHEDILNRYQCVDSNRPLDNLFLTKLMLKEVHVGDHLLEEASMTTSSSAETALIQQALSQEMAALFAG